MNEKAANAAFFYVNQFMIRFSKGNMIGEGVYLFWNLFE